MSENHGRNLTQRSAERDLFDVDPSVERVTKSDIEGFESLLVHQANISKKEADKNPGKYGGRMAQDLLAEIRERYEIWKRSNLELVGPFTDTSEKDTVELIEARVRVFNEYKDFLDVKRFTDVFDSRSNLHSSVLEEFLVYLFGDLVVEFSTNALIGKSKAFRDIFFLPGSYKEMVSAPHARLETKDHDFVIGTNVVAEMVSGGYQTEKEIHQLKLPAVAIECKTYVDKTMLEAMSTAAEDLKARSPNALYIGVAEWLKLTQDYNPRKLKLDQVYILRKQKNTDQEYRYDDSYEKNPIYADVVTRLYSQVRKHITEDWEGGVGTGLKRGYLIPM